MPKSFNFTYGRYNPPTIGHGRLFDRLKETAKGGEYVIIPTRTKDKKKNPIEVNHKLTILKQMFPQHADKILDIPTLKTIIDVLKYAQEHEYETIHLVVGSDRLEEFRKLLNKYNGKEYQFKEIQVISAGERDPDSDGVVGISSTKMREYAKNNDILSFKKGIPPHMNDIEVNYLVYLIQNGLDT